MNRHERRKNKSKGLEDATFYNKLAKAIDIHKSKKFTETEKLYKKLLISYPENYELNRHMGILYQDTGRVEDSFNFFVKCLKKINQVSHLHRHVLFFLLLYEPIQLT